MAGHKCPFCHSVMAISNDTHKAFHINFNLAETFTGKLRDLRLDYYNCPHCGEYSAYITGVSEKTKGLFLPVIPRVNFEPLPEYVPQSIRNDYEEAYLISDLSPKASATLSRRCLQGMIRDFWNICDKTLANEIKQLEGKVSAAQWKVIDSVRRIGNIGAHMEKDIDLIVDIEPNEAKALLRLIERLIQDWYVNRFEQEQLFSEITAMDEEKQRQRALNV